jgi:CRISPR/Cas system-associated exonuclease Cas4 (RecB family)
MALAHSYSSVKDYEGCPRRYHEVRILKKFKSQDTQATLYGTAVHKAFEDYIKDGTPLPAQFAQFHPFVEPLAAVDGEIRCEDRMAIRVDFSPCGFFDKDVWFRGIPDYLAISKSGKTARVADYKTGKSSKYADTAQLELMAAMVMLHHPTVAKVKGALLFVVVGDIIKAEYTRAQLPKILSKWAGRAGAIETAVDAGVWNPRPSALCKFCPLSEEACEHKS